MKRYRYLLLSLLVALLLALTGGSLYMLDFALASLDDRDDVDEMYEMLYSRVPDIEPWADSLRSHQLLRDTFMTMANGERHHAIYLRCDSACGRTAIIVHGYHDFAVKFLFLARLYHDHLGYNVLMPDLHGHGLSEGDEVQMGWLDRLDVMQWADAAERMFRDTMPSQMVVHGVSMGAATTMCLSGEELPPYIKCFVEDCGYTSVWDEFEGQLSELFSLPAFPLMYTTSALCKALHGWSFGEASPLDQVARCSLPMLFIHGSNDTFVPTEMVYRLYAAKPQPKAIWIARGSEHAQSYINYPTEYTHQVAAFVGKYIEGK